MKESNIWNEVNEPYPRLNGGENIRGARGPVQTFRYIYDVTKKALKGYNMLNCTKTSKKKLRIV